MIINSVKILLFVYAASCLLLYFFQNYLLFFPRSTPDANRKKLKSLERTITIGDIKVYGWLKRGESHSPLIIYYGGNGEEASHILMDINKFKNTSLLSINYRGYGDSEGTPSVPNLIGDALYIFDYMVEKEGFAPAEIILMGRSLGSGVAVQVAGLRQVSAVILITPFDSLSHIAKHHYPIFPVNLLLRHNLDSLRLAPRIDRPALIIMAEKDTIVPSRYSKEIIKHWKGSVTEIMIPDAGHNDLSYSDTYWQVIHNFIENQFTKRGF